MRDDGETRKKKKSRFDPRSGLAQWKTSHSHLCWPLLGHPMRFNHVSSMASQPTPFCALLSEYHSKCVLAGFFGCHVMMRIHGLGSKLRLSILLFEPELGVIYKTTQKNFVSHYRPDHFPFHLRTETVWLVIYLAIKHECNWWGRPMKHDW